MRLKYSPIILLFILNFFSSCVVNSDFDQINLDIEPVAITPLVFFELDQIDFLDDTGTIEIETVTDFTDLEVFQSSVVQENLLRVDFQFEIRNTFDRRFIVEAELLSANNTVLHTFQPLNIAPGNESFESQEIIRINENPGILNTRRARVTVTLIPGTNVIDPDVQQRIQFRSTGRFYLRI